jgi:hypothetical protein
MPDLPCCFCMTIGLSQSIARLPIQLRPYIRFLFVITLTLLWTSFRFRVAPDTLVLRYTSGHPAYQGLAPLSIVPCPAHDRMADYSANPLADPDKQISRIRLLKLMICYLMRKLKLFAFSAICPSFVPIFLFPQCGFNVSLVQSINLTSYFPTVDRSDGASPPTCGTI